MNDGSPGLVIHDAVGGLRLVGEIDGASTADLSARLDPLPGLDGDIQIDLSGVGFIDSTGLRVLIDAHQRAQKCGRRVVMTRPSVPVRRLFDISGLVPYLHVGATDG
jgi:anti-sigma B factor antagonist